MRQSAGFQQTLPEILPRRPRRQPAERAVFRGWRRPTFGELVRQIEHEFGDSVDTSTLYLTRADRNEPLTPASVRALCEQLGIPPEDFGV